jgi:heat shock protein HtpX
MWFKRIGLFFIVNILIMVTISITTSALGVRRYIGAYGLDLKSLLVFCAICGFAGSFISLMLSKWMAKTMMGVEIVSETGPYSNLVRSIKRLSLNAGIAMPEVGVYDSPEINAFATGPSSSNSLVAVSTGLLDRMSDEEIEGVLAHEVSHIANGDMVTLTLIQGVVNTFSMFLSRILSYAVTSFLSKDEDDRGGGFNYLINTVLVIVFDIVFSILGSMVVAYFSRLREFKADAGGAKLAGRNSMIAALQNLQRAYSEPEVDTSAAVASMKISSHKGGWFALFSTHPPLEDRIAALRNLKA